MMLKESRQKSPLFALGGKFLKDRPNRIFGLLGFLFILSLGISFILGAYLYKSGYLSDTVRPAILRDIVYLPNKLHAMLTKPEVEHLVIDIKHKDYMKLAYSRAFCSPRMMIMLKERYATREKCTVSSCD